MLDLGFLNAGFDIVWVNDMDKYAVNFIIEQIVRKHIPRIIVLENVKNLDTHNVGETFDRM